MTSLHFRISEEGNDLGYEDDLPGESATIATSLRVPEAAASGAARARLGAALRPGCGGHQRRREDKCRVGERERARGGATDAEKGRTQGLQDGLPSLLNVKAFPRSMSHPSPMSLPNELPSPNELPPQRVAFPCMLIAAPYPDPPDRR